MKKIYSLMLFSLLSGVANANEAFDKTENIAEEFLEFMTGPFVTTFLALAIVVAGLFLVKGRGNPALMWGILFGAILIGSASQIATWLLG